MVGEESLNLRYLEHIFNQKSDFGLIWLKNWFDLGQSLSKRFPIGHSETKSQFEEWLDFGYMILFYLTINNKNHFKIQYCIS